MALYLLCRYTRIHITLYIILHYNCASTDSLSIRHEGSELVTSPGINVTLACVVRGSGYNYFYHQVVWYKVMASDGGEGEDVQINTGAIINPPFLATGRYTVEPDVSTQQQIVSVPLSIRGR